MKKIISLFLGIILIFVFSCSAFALTSYESDVIYYLEWIDSKLGSGRDGFLGSIDLYLDSIFDLLLGMDRDNTYFYNLTNVNLQDIIYSLGYINDYAIEIHDLVNTNDDYNAYFRDWYTRLFNYNSANDKYEGFLYSFYDDVHSALYDTYDLLEYNILELWRSRLDTFGGDFGYVLTQEVWEEFNWFERVDYSLGMLQEGLVSSEDIRIDKSMIGTKETLLDTFLSSSDGFSYQVDNIGTLYDLTTDLSDTFDVGLSPTDFFNFFSDTVPWLFFTQESKDSLTTVSSSRARAQVVNNQPEIVTHYYEDNKSEFDKYLGLVGD